MSVAFTAASAVEGSLVMAWRRIKLSSNTAISSFSFMLRLAGQIGYFLIIARALGPRDYGAVATVFAVLTIIGCFSGWGCEHILVKNVAIARDRFGDYFGNALILVVATGPVLALIAYGVSLFAAPMALLPFVAFAVAELFFARLNALGVAGFMALENGPGLLVLNAGFSAIRLATCVVAIVMSSRLDVEGWALWYLGGTALSGLLSYAYTVKRLGGPRWYIARTEWGMGFHFCLFYTADAALRDLDKPLVAYFAGPAAAGLYTAAYRIVDAAAMPMRAMIASIYARFFVHGNKGIDNSIGFAFKVLPILLGYCLFLGIFLAAGSQLLPMILGDKFAASAPLIGRLAILPFFGALTSIGGNILTSTGRQRTRALVVLVLSFSPVVLCSILVPRFGLDGAAAASVLNAVLFATATWAMVNFSRNAEHRRMAHAKA